MGSEFSSKGLITGSTSREKGEEGLVPPTVPKGDKAPDARARKESPVTLTKAFLNCNELPKSELCSFRVASSRLDSKKESRPPSPLSSSYKGPREPRIHIYIHAHTYTSLIHPTSWIYLHWSPASAFFICPRVGRSIGRGCFIYIDGTCPTCPESARYTVFVERMIRSRGRA